MPPYSREHLPSQVSRPRWFDRDQQHVVAASEQKRKPNIFCRTQLPSLARERLGYSTLLPTVVTNTPNLDIEAQLNNP